MLHTLLSTFGRTCGRMVLLEMGSPTSFPHSKPESHRFDLPGIYQLGSLVVHLATGSCGGLSNCCGIIWTLLFS